MIKIFTTDTSSLICLGQDRCNVELLLIIEENNNTTTNMFILELGTSLPDPKSEWFSRILALFTLLHSAKV